MAVISTRTFVGDGARPLLTLAGEEYVRPLGIGNTWNQLKISLSLAFRGPAANVANCSFVIGVCSGNGFPYGGATTTNFVGALIGFNGNLYSTWSYYTSGTEDYYNYANPTSITRVGSTIAMLGGADNWYMARAGGGTFNKRSFMSVVITKGNPNYNVALYTSTAAQSITDLTNAKFLEAAECNTQGGSALAFSLNTNPACSEANGVLDTLDISWNLTAYPIEIYGIMISRIT